MQAAGSSYVITDADVDEGEVDETVRNLSDGVTREGYTDHFHGKGQKNFVDSYLELWEKVRSCLLNIAWPSKHFLWQQQTEVVPCLCMNMPLEVHPWQILLTHAAHD